MKLRKAAKKTGRRPVLVHWVDSSTSPNWVETEREVVRPIEIYTLGWLVEKTPGVLVVAASTTKGPPDQAQNPTAIPRCAVISWIYFDKDPSC